MRVRRFSVDSLSAGRSVGLLICPEKLTLKYKLKTRKEIGMAVQRQFMVNGIRGRAGLELC